MSKKIALAKDIIQVADCHAENANMQIAFSLAKQSPGRVFIVPWIDLAAVLT
jgi:hypothetical protein